MNSHLHIWSGDLRAMVTKAAARIQRAKGRSQAMSHGIFTNNNGESVEFGFSSITDWFDSVINSFAAPWIIGDNTHYGTEIFDARAIKVLSVWMAWGDPSDRQRDSMTDSEWLEYCCDSHWESQTQWHIANAIVSTRNYLDANKRRGWYGDDERQREILRNLIMTYGRWAESVNSEIACGGPNRRMTSAEAEKEKPHLAPSAASVEHVRPFMERERDKLLDRIKALTPAAATNPEAAEARNHRHAMFAAIARMAQERAREIGDIGGLPVMSVVMDGPYLERMADIAEEEYDRIKRETEPKRRSGSGKAGEDQRAG
jgi:hypothetical protein